MENEENAEIGKGEDISTSFRAFYGYKNLVTFFLPLLTFLCPSLLFVVANKVSTKYFDKISIFLSIFQLLKDLR
ncbi:hypothetical protein [Methanosarcina sp.]|uniref:hypothetical protein n=1 Tax=Methanosarcina sp. TaxID=2213 RepID=UPI0029883A8B|nr:hypothetical protein [Methanosarcina sp.]MDW5561544.1 hypothetical protein [Methanosarcina sp.]